MEVLKTHRSSIHKYAEAYRKERMGQIEQKTKMSSQKKKPRKIVAKPDKKEEDFEKMPVELLEGGGEEMEEVTYTLNDVPVEVPEVPIQPPSMPPTIVQYPQEMTKTPETQTPTQESVTDVLKVPEEKEEDKEKEESQGGETKKSITVNL
jgi:hypothetical protein